MSNTEYLEGWKVFWKRETDLGVTTYAELFPTEDEAEEAASAKVRQDASGVVIEHGTYPIEDWGDREVVSVHIYEGEDD